MLALLPELENVGRLNQMSGILRDMEAPYQEI